MSQTREGPTDEVLSKEEAMRRFLARKAGNSAPSASAASTGEEAMRKQEQAALKKALADKLITEAATAGKNDLALQRFLSRKGIKRESSSAQQGSGKRQQQSCLAAC